MTYFIFLAGFTGMGLVLLAWLVVTDELAARQSSRDLSTLKSASDEAARSEMEEMKAAGEGVGEGGSGVAEEFIRRIRRMTAKKGKRRARPRFDEEGPQADRARKEWEDLDTYLRVVRLLRETFVLGRLEEREFPVRAYSRADADTRESVRRLMVLLRSEREASKAGISPD